MDKKPNSSVFWVGKYLSLAMTLPASVFAGYLVGNFANHYWHRDFLPAVGILLGMAGGIYKVVEEVSRDGER